MESAALDARELVFAGVARQAEMVRTKEVSPVELVRATLARIEHLDGELNAFRVVLADRAMAEAQAIETRVAAGEQGALLGVPIAIKDDMEVEGEPMVWGSSAHGPAEKADCDLVRRLRAAGAIVVGITRTPELTIWPFTESASGGVTRNPWDLQRTPGGSSGGSATAVAAGLVAGATASDGGGSIRIPAACCGLFGLKPQRDRISLAPHREKWNGLSVSGFVSRSVEDSALLYEAVTGQPYVAAAAREPGRLRVALSTKMPTGLIARLDPAWKRAAEDAADLLTSLGHEVIERDPDYGINAVPGFLTRYLTGIRHDVRHIPHPERLERRSHGMARMGTALLPNLRRARRRAAIDAARINAIFDDVDVVLGPAMAKSPLKVGHFEGHGANWTFNGVARFVPYNLIWNHVGNPAASVPFGQSDSGLPLSVQIAGPPDGEERLFSLAAQMEAARPWAQRRPAFS